MWKINEFYSKSEEKKCFKLPPYPKEKLGNIFFENFGWKNSSQLLRMQIFFFLCESENSSTFYSFLRSERRWANLNIFWRTESIQNVEGLEFSSHWTKRLIIFFPIWAQFLKIIVFCFSCLSCLSRLLANNQAWKSQVKD